MSNQSSVDGSDMDDEQDLQEECYRPVAHLHVELGRHRANLTYAPTFMMPLAEFSRPARGVVEGIKQDQNRLQQRKLTYLDEYAEKMPTYIIRTADMKLINKAEAVNELRSFIRTEPGEDGDTISQDSARLASFAVLSHRWGVGEVTFQDMCGEPDHDSLRKTRAGFRKVEKFCEVARMHGCNWAWADTCCIDKTSSSELDEAIRSMYRWYRDAAICIIYLANTVYLDDFEDDAWFTRGWTLQELLAPKRIKFFNSDWLPLTPDQNDKDKGGDLLDLLSAITSIPCDDIADFQVGTDRVVEKMRWAAPRSSTRIEDVAYSLIGIFDVSMVIMYGEGWRAFYRLQLAIAEQRNTTELFFWKGTPSYFNSMLAPEPESFVPPDHIPVPSKLTSDELKQFTPLDAWRLIAAMIKADFESCKRISNDIRNARKLRRKRRGKQRAQAREDEWRIVQKVWRGLLESMETETMQRIGPGLLRRMDGGTLRQIGHELLKNYPGLVRLLDECTRKRIYLELLFVQWGGHQYAMTGAGLALDVILYDVQIIQPWYSVDPEEPFAVHVGNWRSGRRVDSRPETPSFDNSSDTGGYVTASENCFDDPRQIQDGLMLAVLDYYWSDTFHKPDRLHTLERSTNSDSLSIVIEELGTRLYRGVFLSSQDGIRGYNCFRRASTNGNNVTLVRRPEGGWDRPQRVYIE